MTDPARATPSTPAREPDSPHQRTTKALARLLIEYAPGSRIPNVSDLRQIAGVGAGTVQKVLQSFQASGAVDLSSKQRQGTIVIRRDLAALWGFAELRPLTVLMPLPNSWEFQGLASGLRDEISALGVPSIFLFGHGSEERARAVRDAIADVAIMSAFAARANLTDGLVDAAVLPAGSYYAPDSVIVLSRTERERMPKNPRIGIDRGSSDHIALTLREFPDSDLVDVSYAHIPSALTRGSIDAAVWHRSATAMSLADRELVFWAPQSDQDSASSFEAAALVVAAENRPARAVVQAVDFSTVLARQNAVVDGDLLPNY